MPAKRRPTLKFDPASSAWIGLRLSVVSNRYMNALYAEIERQQNLLRDDVAVIACLSITTATTAQEIVRYTGRPKNSISRAVTGLEEAGLLRRSTHPDDSRAASLALTASGRRAFKQISRHSAEHDARLIANLNEDERRAFARLLNIISDPALSLG